MRRLAPLLALVALAGCDLFAHPSETPIAAGSLRMIGAAAGAARRCGVRDTRLDPLDTRRAVLLLGQRHTAEAETCLRHWIERNSGRLDAELLSRVTRA